MSKARELAQELADGPTWAIRWSKLAVNKWLKQQANLILDASLAYEMMTFAPKIRRGGPRLRRKTQTPLHRPSQNPVKGGSRRGGFFKPPSPGGLDLISLGANRALFKLWR